MKKCQYCKAHIWRDAGHAWRDIAGTICPFDGFRHMPQPEATRPKPTSRELVQIGEAREREAQARQRAWQAFTFAIKPDVLAEHRAQAQATLDATRPALVRSLPDCLYNVPAVCTARWNSEDWQRACVNPSHNHNR